MIRLAGYEPLFDATAAASRGLNEPSGFDWEQVGVAAVLGGLGAGAVSLLRKRNKPQLAA